MRVAKKAKRSKVPFYENPEFDAWRKANSKLVERFNCIVHDGDTRSLVTTSLYVQLAGGYIWKLCDGKRVGWHRFDTEGFLFAVRGLPGWNQDYEDGASADLFAFFVFLSNEGLLDPVAANTVLRDLGPYAGRAFQRVLSQPIDDAPISSRLLN